MGDSANSAGASDDTRKLKDPAVPQPVNLLDQRLTTDSSTEEDDDESDASMSLGSEADKEFDNRGQKSAAQAAAAEVEEMLGTEEINCGDGEAGEQNDDKTPDQGQPPKELLDGQPRESGAEGKSNVQKIVDYDSKFDVAQKRLDAALKTALADSKTGKDALSSSQTQSLTLIDAIGQQRAAAETGGDKEAIAKREQELELNSGVLEVESLEKLDRLPTRARDLQVLNGCFLISNGKDENVRAGEKALAELIRDNPALVKDEKFRDSVMRAYSEMTAMRDARGLPPWSTQLKVDDILPERKAVTAAGDQSPEQLMENANEKFFNEGIEKALPFFDQAQDLLESGRNKTDRERISLFIQGISLDAQIAQRSFAKADAADLAEQRAEISGKEESSLTDSRQLLNRSIAAGINKTFAKIASGDAIQFAEAKKELATYLEEHPSIAFNAEFKETSRNAFKAHYQSRKADAVAGTPPARTGEPTPAGKTDEANPAKTTDSPPAKGEESNPVKTDGDVSNTVKPQYKGDWTADAGKLKVDDDVEVKPYAVDTATSVGVAIFGIGVGVAGFLRARSAHRAARELKATVDKAHEVKPIESKMPGYDRDGITYGVKSEASDGRMIVKASDGPKGAREASTGQDAPLAEVKPDNFNPKKAKFADFTPITVDGERYYASKEGTVFKHTGGLLKETAETRAIRLVKPEEYGKQRVNNALIWTDARDLVPMITNRTFEQGHGPRFERINDSGIATARRLEEGLLAADWKPYEPVGENNQPKVKPPLHVMRAEIQGGRLDFTSIDSLPADATITLVKEKSENWCLTVDKPGLKGDAVGYATMVLGPKKGFGAGNESIMHVQPGEPYQSVDKVSTFDMIRQSARLRSDGLEIPGLDRATALSREPQQFTVTREQAKALGFATVRVENKLSNMTKSGQVATINAFADSFERANDVNYGADTVKLLRDAARAVNDYKPGFTDPQKLAELMTACDANGKDLYQAGRYDESVTFTEIQRKLESMARDEYVETLDKRPQEALRRTMVADGRQAESYLSRFAATDGPTNEKVQQHQAKKEAAQNVADLIEKKTSAGQLKHSTQSYADLAVEIDGLATANDTNNPKLATAYREQAEKVRAFDRDGFVTLDGIRMDYSQDGRLFAVMYRDKIYQPGSIEVKDGVLEGKGDVEGWLRRDPRRIFELAKQLSSGDLKGFDMTLGAAVQSAAENLSQLTPQQIHDGLSEILNQEKAAVRDGKSPAGLRFLHAAGVTSKPAGGGDASHNDHVTRGRSEYRPDYYSPGVPTALDQRWRGLETGIDHKENDRNWLAGATGRYVDGVIVTKDGAVMAVGDAKAWLSKDPLRVLDVVKMTGEGETIGLNLIQDLRAVAADLDQADRGALFDKMLDCLDAKSPKVATQAVQFMETAGLKQIFPEADFSSAETTRNWLMKERIRQAVAATPDAYMHQILNTRTPDNRMGSYWETVGDGKVATPESLARALSGLEVKPYDPVDASGRPVIKPPARAFQADLPGGRMGLVNLDSLPPGTKLSLVDPKGTGNWSAAVESANVVGDKTDKVTFIVGPDTDAQGRPNGKEIIWTIHPGDAVSPSAVNDQALASANQALERNGKGLAGIAAQGEIPKAELGKPRTITGVTVEQAKALGFGLAKVATPQVAQVDRSTQSDLLEQQASRFPKSSGSALDEGANRLLTDTAKAVRDFQPNATQGDRLRRLHTDMKEMATKLTEAGRFGDAIVFNEASSVLEPIAARSEANKVIADIKAKAIGLQYGDPVRDHYMQTAVYMEKVLNRGGFSDNRWGYDMMRQVMDSRLGHANVMGQRTDAFEMASAGLKKICESMPEATTKATEPGIAQTVAGSLTRADSLEGFEGHTAEEIRGAHKSGNESALRLVQQAEANPQFKRNASGYALVADLVQAEARTRTAQADALAARGEVDYVKMQRAEGIAEVANVIAAEGRSRHSRDLNAVENLFQTARDAASGPVDEARVKAVQRDAASLKEISPQALHTEITNLLLSEKPAEALDFLKKTGVLKQILPEVDALDGVAQDVRTNPENNVWEHVKMSVETASRESHHLTEPQRKALVWAALLKDTGTRSTQVVTPVDGEPPRVTYPNSERASADHTNRILDRFSVPVADQELIHDLVAEHKNIRTGIAEDKARELHGNHGADAVVFAELQRVEALSRRVHTAEQYERLKLAEGGLPSPIKPDGQPVSREQYWAATSHQAEIQSQMGRIERGETVTDGSAPADLLQRMGRTVSGDATIAGSNPHNTGAHEPTALMERAQRFPSIKDGVKALVDQGRLDLANKILELSGQGPLQMRAEALLTDPRRLADPARVDQLSELVGLKNAPAATTSSAQGERRVGTVSTSATTGDVGVTGERHNTLGETRVSTKAPAPEVMVTIYETGIDGVAVERRVALVDVPPEELGKRLSNLTDERLAKEIRATEEQIRNADREQRTADLEGHRQRLADLNEIRTLRDGYMSAERTGGGKQFIEARKSAFSGKGAALAKVGLVSALLLLFNELVPDVQLKGAGAGRRVRPQGI